MIRCLWMRRVFRPPQGYARIPTVPGGFGAWLRGLPLRPGCPPVRDFAGRVIDGTQHCAVLDIDVGVRDLQQCADAVIRLRAEYLLARGCEDAIAFEFTSGDLATWRNWRSGLRPRRPLSERYRQ